MAHKKKGHLTTSPEWAKHLRKYMKNQFWKGERKASKELIRSELFESDNLMWQFQELIKTLIAMSMPYKGQKEFYGIGATADEMLEDFYSYYTLNKVRFVERKLINKGSKKRLDDIDFLTDKWSSEKEEGFWFEMENHKEDWDILREKAKLTLKILDKSNLTVDVNHENEFDENGDVISQRTKIELKEKITTPQQHLNCIKTQLSQNVGKHLMKEQSMSEIITGITIIGFVLAFFSFGVGIYMNIWIYYSADQKKFPLFPILNPFSISSYELMLNSMFKMNWKVEGENEKIKRKSNKLRRFSGIMLLVTIASGILSLILN